MSFEIDKNTGVFQLGNYVIDPRLPYNKFKSIHPDLVEKYTDNTDPDIESHYIRIPGVEFLDEEHSAVLTFRRRHLTLLSLDRIDKDTDLSWRDYLLEVCNWVLQVKKWAQSEWGYPDDISGGVFTDEMEYLNKIQLQSLSRWTYQFIWGKSTLGYHWQTSDTILFSFDTHYQINTWDAFLGECHYLLDVEKDTINQHGILLKLIEEAIIVLREHFDYLRLKPRIYNNGVVGFAIDPATIAEKYRKNITLSRALITVKMDDKTQPYYVSRTDSRVTWKANLAGLPQLVEEAIKGEGFELDS